MRQQISVITLGVTELSRSRRFYVEGFGWRPVFEHPEILFLQMNGLMLGTWLKGSFPPSPFALLPGFVVCSSSPSSVTVSPSCCTYVAGACGMAWNGAGQEGTRRDDDSQAFRAVTR